VSVELPQQLRGLKAVTGELNSSTANQIKKGRREASERPMTAQERERFTSAKQVMRARWALEFKINQKGGSAKPKARLAASGFIMGPQREPTRRGKAWAIPALELARAVGILAGAAAKPKEAAHGLVEAAIKCYLTVSGAMAEQRWALAKMDPCAWVLHGRDRGSSKERAWAGLEALLLDGPAKAGIVAHRYPKAESRPEARIDWKGWGRGVFYQTGVEIAQGLDEGSQMDWEKYVKDIEEIHKTQARAALVAIGWRSEQTGPMRSADVSWHLCDVPHSAVKPMGGVNELVDRVREQADKGAWAHSHWGSEVFAPVARAVSSEANRPDGGSTKELAMAMAPLEVLAATRSMWKSGKTDKIRRSSAAAERWATVDGEDENYGLKLQWLEMLGDDIDWRSSQSAMCCLPAACSTDSRGLFGELKTVVFTPKGKEKRVDIEAMTMKGESARDGNRLTRVHVG
ncbi:unnamed protein product, partial [Prorocentrum cordatum]